ncbi:MAG: N-acetylmuramoyl-L-alanine amidase [Methylothermaceae bacterium]|nr:N-acetylmuramoyl-L-alanine amidase [Methylothermaceae bacterium]
MAQRKLWWWLLIGFAFAQAGFALEIEGVRYWNAPDHIRVVLDTSEPVKPKVFGLENPRRLVIDLPRAKLEAALPELETNPFLQKIRAGRPKSKVLRVVLDLKKEIQPKVFVLAPNAHYGHRLVVDLYGEKKAVAEPEEVKQKASPKPSQPREVVVAIDAGHGGEDPGAIGRRGTREKDVVLAIARKLAWLINRNKGMKAVLTRDGDYYVPLRKRIDLARQAKADLFVSIHADSFKHASARGSGVYILSERGASSEAARWLAARENAADLVGGVSLDDKDDVLAKVLLDLSLTATREHSQSLAKEVLTELERIGRIHKKSVQSAGFVVLKSPDIPSVLVETAFISNPTEEQRLRSSRYQNYWAKAIHRGIQDYFTTYAPPGTILAQERRHVISRGETLSEIAARYGVSLRRLMADNELHDSTIQAGQVLRIPVGG